MTVPTEERNALTSQERRYLTIVFCDLVGFTELSERLDPEELNDVQKLYQRAALPVMENYGGYVGAYSGDGILVYFGYPVAHENDAERATRAALELIDKIRALELRVGDQVLNPLQARIGIHTGLVVIAPEQTSSRQNLQGAIGEPVNLAARLQSEAPANSVVVSADTLELIEGLFDTEFLGPRKIRGLTRRVDVHRIVRPRHITGSVRRYHRRGATRMVGREEPLERLRRHWSDVRQSTCCRTVFVEGEAGVGKTRLVSEFCRLTEIDKSSVVQISCHEIFSSTPLFPIAGLLSNRIGLAPDVDARTARAQLAQYLDELGANTPENFEAAIGILGLTANSGPNKPAPDPPASRARQFAFILGLVKIIVKLQPAILWVEDAHWLDASSAELLRDISTQLRDEPILILLTLRSFPNNPGLPAPDDVVALGPLPPAVSIELARAIPGVQELPEQLVAQAVEAGDGTPLFIEQLLLSAIDQHAQRADGFGGVDKIPLTLAETLSERLHRLPGGRRVVQAAACIGRAFTPEFIESVLGREATPVTDPLNALVEAEILRARHDGNEQIFEFRHALLQRAAYESMVRADKHALHSAIVVALDGSASTSPILPELKAHHLTAAGRNAEAIPMWLAAGIAAAQRSAHVEAVNNLRNGLGLISDVSDPKARRDMELRLLAALIGSLTATAGSSSPAVSECCRRGLQLVSDGEPTPLVFPFLFGQFTYAMCTGNLKNATEMANLFLSLAERNSYAPGRVIGHRLVGMAFLGAGDALRAKEELAKSIALYLPERDEGTTYLFGQNTQIHSRSMLSLALFCAGLIEDSLRIGTETLRTADTLRHPHSTTIALSYVGGWVFGLCGEADGLAREAQRLIGLSERHRLLAFRTFGAAFYGWALCQKGKFAEGIPLLQRAVDAFESVGYRLSLPGHLANLADAKRRLGRIEEARAHCARAMQVIAEGSDRWLEPEVRRVAAEIAGDIANEDRAAIEQQFRAAAKCARDLGFPVFELRCLNSLQNYVGANGLDADSAARLKDLSQFAQLSSHATQILRDYETNIAVNAEP